MPADITDAAFAMRHDPALALGPDEKHAHPNAHATELPPGYEGQPTLSAAYVGDDYPTAEELLTLRKVANHIPWGAYTVAFVELCERFSFYGTTIVCEFAIKRIPTSITQRHF